MKLALIACLLAVSVISSEAYWGYGYGGLYGGYYGGLYGGMWGGLYGGLYGGYGYGYWGKRDTQMMPPAHLKNRTECAFISSKEVLSCHGPETLVECPAKQTLPNSEMYEMFGLGYYTDKNNMFRIVPRKLDNSGWTSGLYDATNMKYATLSASEEFLGLMVTDEECWNRMVEGIFKKSERKEKTFVEDKTVVMFGDLMIAKDLPQEVVAEKRQAMRDEEWTAEKRAEDWNTEKRDMFMDKEEREWDMEREAREASEYPYHGKWNRRSADWDMEEREAEYPSHGNQWSRRSADWDMEEREAEYQSHGNQWSRRNADWTSEYEMRERDADYNKRSWMEERDAEYNKRMWMDQNRPETY